MSMPPEACRPKEELVALSASDDRFFPLPHSSLNLLKPSLLTGRPGDFSISQLMALAAPSRSRVFINVTRLAEQQLQAAAVAGKKSREIQCEVKDDY